VTARLVVRPAAEADIRAAALWYESRSPGLGGEFLRAIDVACMHARRDPRRWQERAGSDR
jgi:hypothetical protein